MYFLSKNCFMAIPNYIKLVFCQNQNLFILKLGKRLNYFKFPVNYLLLTLKNKIYIIIKVSQIQSKKTVIICKSLMVFIKKCIYENLNKIYKKLNIVGIGFKVFKVIYFLTEILVFKLGFSHSIYLKIPTNIILYCIQFLKLFLISNFLYNIISLVFCIKSFKFTDLYVGKGIFFYNEKIRLKKNKTF